MPNYDQIQFARNQSLVTPFPAWGYSDSLHSLPINERKNWASASSMAPVFVSLCCCFLSEFTKLVALSIAIAIPIAYLMTDYWLNNFAYRTTIDIWVFIVWGLTAMSIAGFTVGFQSFSAANGNPVDVLKNE